jgi:hypothetical protein
MELAQKRGGEHGMRLAGDSLLCGRLVRYANRAALGLRIIMR